MAYLGNTPQNQAFTPAIDYFSGNGSTTAFTLSRPVASVAQMIVAVANVIQNPSSAYTVSGNTITFSSAPPSGTNNIWVEYTSLITNLMVPGQGTVNAQSLAPNTLTPAGVSGQANTASSYLDLPKEDHWKIIEERVKIMINNGLINEVDHLLKKMKEVIKPFIDFKDPRLCPFFGTAVSDASDTSRSPFCGVVSLQFGSFTLRDHLDGNWLSPEELMPAIKAIAGGMAVLHSNGTVHGKLVPEHVSECDGFWKLINYGLWEVENEIKAIKGYETTPPPTKKDDIRAFFQIVTSIGSPVDPAIFSCDSFEQILQKL